MANDYSAILVELAQQVRGFTIELLEAFSDQDLLRPLPGLRNHALWHAGHALWLADALSVVPLTGGSELPAGWALRFGQGSKPAQIASWPSRTEIVELLEQQLRRLVVLYQQAPSARWADASRHPRTGWPLLAGIIHGWHDEARHHGEMLVLWKSHRAGSGESGS